MPEFLKGFSKKQLMIGGAVVVLLIVVGLGLIFGDAPAYAPASVQNWMK